MPVDEPSLLAPRRQPVGAILANRAFVPVFQPIVDIATGLVVGYEALSRFDGGSPADVFAEARAVGLDLDLELATLRAALVAARRLPGGRWLDLNVSRRALDDPRLRSAIAIADRRVMIELLAAEIACCDTQVNEIVRGFGGHAGLAVIVDDPARELSPDLAPKLVKLARSLTVRAAAEPRPDWLEGLAGRTAATLVVAEGVETSEEARALVALGVDLGQGLYFGRPALATLRPSIVN
jgi:EAL domain-containing protein (putative c-di-GMP-specific phosphodiesterase class I)